MENKTYSRYLRLWHWLNVLVITGLLLTVVLNSTLLHVRENATHIRSDLAQAGAVITPEQARSVAHAISAEVWGVHRYLGYTLFGLLLFRLAAGVIRPATKHPRGKGAKTLYVLVYFWLGVSGFTGLCMAFEDSYSWLQHFPVKRDIHQLSMYVLIVLSMVHLAGVWRAERKDRQGITSDMINGGISTGK